MSFKKSRRLWIAVPMILAASWITARVVTADTAPRRAVHAVAPPVTLVDGDATADLRDPALEGMIARFATEARHTAR